MDLLAKALGVERSKGSKAGSSKTGDKLARASANSSKETDETAMPKERQEQQDCEFQWGSLKGMHMQAADRQAFTSLSCPNQSNDRCTGSDRAEASKGPDRAEASKEAPRD